MKRILPNAVLSFNDYVVVVDIWAGSTDWKGDFHHLLACLLISVPS